MERAGVPLAAGDLPPQRAVAVVVIEVLPAGALADPQERPVAEPRRRAVLGDPRLGRLAQQRLRVAAVERRGVQVEPGLLAVLHLVDDAAAVRHPAHVDDEVLRRGVAIEVHPRRGAAGDADDAQPDARVGVAGLRVVPRLHGEAPRNVIDDGEFRHRPLVELQEGEMARGGAPPVGAVVAAPVDLLLVDPVELAVQQLRAAVGGEPALAPVVDVHHVQVVAAHEADQLAVRAEGELLLGLHRRGEPLRAALGVERNVVEVVVDGHDGGGARRVHLEPAAGERRPITAESSPSASAARSLAALASKSGVAVPEAASTFTHSTPPPAGRGHR